MTFILTFWRLTCRRCAALGVGLLALAARRTGVLANPQETANLRASRYLIFVFALVAAGIAGAGILYFRHHEKLQREDLEHRLSAIAELKTADLAQWRAERLLDAAFLSRNAVFTELVRHAFANPQDRQAQERVHRWLRELREVYSYESVHLFDAQGVTRITDPTRHVPADETSFAREALRAGQIVFMDFHRDAPGDAIELSLLVSKLNQEALMTAGEIAWNWIRVRTLL